MARFPASIRYRVAIGPGAGSRTLTLKNPGLQRSDTQPKPFTVDRNGFSLNVAVACQGQQRERLERLCRYVTRPAVCLERLSTNAAGQVSYELKHPFRDGTTHILFTPEDLLARLAALVPKPRSNLTRYFYRIGGGPCAQLAIQESSGPWISESVAQQIKETDNTDLH